MNADVTRANGSRLLEVMTWWTLVAALIVAGAGAYLTRTPTFAVGCALGAGLDIALVSAAVRRHGAATGAAGFDGAAAMIMGPGRIVAKGGLLALSLALPRVASFPGTVAGVLCFDLTLAFGGSALMIWQGMHGRVSGGETRGDLG